MTDPLRLYSESLSGTEPAAWLRLRNGTVFPLPLERYLAPADDTDGHILASVRGPVLDVGCGPGRHLHALARGGVFALGVDLSPTAVSLARKRGGQAIVGSIFADVPGPGTWKTALLLDGNIGIGGAPERLVARLRALLAPDGEIIVELAPPSLVPGRFEARIETGQSKSSWFKWAHVTTAEVEPLADRCGYHVGELWTRGGRSFARLK